MGIFMSVAMKGQIFLPDQKGSVFQWLLSWEKHCSLSLYWWHGSSFFFLLCCLAFRSFFICRRSLRRNRFLNRAILILLLRSCRIWRARCLRACRICFFCNFFRVILFLSLLSHLQIKWAFKLCIILIDRFEFMICMLH